MPPNPADADIGGDQLNFVPDLPIRQAQTAATTAVGKTLLRHAT